MAKVLVCGEALIDLIEQPDGSLEIHAGGSPMNTAVALGRLGVEVAFLGRLSTDEYGTLLRAHLEKSNVNLDLCATVDNATTLAVATLDENGAATYDFRVDGATDGTWSEADLRANLDEFDVIAVSGSLALPITPLADVVEQLIAGQRQKRTVVLDLNFRPGLILDRDILCDRVDRWMNEATIVKASAEDLAWRWPERSVDQVTEEWIEKGVPIAVVTNGEDGAYARTGDTFVWRPAPSVKVADTVGAGDTFTAGLIDWWLSNKTSEIDLAAMLDAALEVASDSCTRPGADPPWRSV